MKHSNRGSLHPLISIALVLNMLIITINRMWVEIHDYVAIPLLLCGLVLMFVGLYKQNKSKES